MAGVLFCAALAFGHAVVQKASLDDAPVEPNVPTSVTLRFNSGIEQALYLSSSTVEKHVNSIFTKLSLPDTGVHRRVAAVLAFLQSAPS